jgi:hypothetical protein
MALTVAHVGYAFIRYPFYLQTENSGHPSDTRILLCSSHGGTAYAMTENHRAEGRIESVRLRRMMGTGVIADSFGDARFVKYVFRGTHKLTRVKVDGCPRKYTEVGPHLIIPDSTSAHRPLAWET